MVPKLRGIIAAALTAVFVTVAAVPVSADVPYQSYTYNYWALTVPAAAAYAPTFSIGGDDIDPSLGQFLNPEDLFVDKNGDIYLLDTGKNRVVVFDKHLKLKKVIATFERDGQTDSFKNPNGICVTNNFDVYIADTDNRRIVVLDKDNNFVKQIEKPEHDTLAEDFIFSPVKVSVDQADRVYAIVKNVFEGIMSFDSDGTFFGYFGTINVNYTPMDYFWRIFSTSAQRAKQRLFIPTEFASLDVDQYGFVFATNVDTWEGNKVKRLNPSGTDVLVNYNTETRITGDQRFMATGRLSGRSMFVDIKARPNGMYSALDSTRGRLYTYDSEGNLLYILGGTGSILGMGRRPVAVEVLDDNILILDKLRGEIIYFEPTTYGSLINEAIALRYNGDESSAVDKWKQVLTLNENYTLAYTGIGKAMLAAGDNRNAMDYLKKGMSVQYYSVAFKRYRNDVLKANLGIILTVLVVAVIGYFGFQAYRKRRKGTQSEKEGMLG